MSSSPYLPNETNGTALSEKRWQGIQRDYTPADVERLRGTLRVRVGVRHGTMCVRCGTVRIRYRPAHGDRVAQTRAVCEAEPHREVTLVGPRREPLGGRDVHPPALADGQRRRD